MKLLLLRGTGKVKVLVAPGTIQERMLVDRKKDNGKNKYKWPKEWFLWKYVSQN
jgi:hypothetical protein